MSGRRLGSAAVVAVTPLALAPVAGGHAQACLEPAQKETERKGGLVIFFKKLDPECP